MLLIVSADWFNRGGMRDVVVLGVYPGDQRNEGIGPFGMVITVDGEPWTVVRDEVQIVEKELLVRFLWQAPTSVMDAIGATLRKILSPNVSAPSKPATPSQTPTQDAVRYAELWINSYQQVKPIVILSSAEYDRVIEHQYVIACRVSSKVSTVRVTDVQVGMGSKVVCSNVMSVPVADIRSGSPATLRSVSGDDAAKIRDTVYRILGI